MRKPVIGITANILTLENCSERAAVGTDYVKVVEMAGGVPMILPVVTNKIIAQAQIMLIDGLILSGGYDVDPLLFGEQPDKRIGYVDPDRDNHEIWLVKSAAHLKLPVFGICRGIQLINIAFGGTIYQDLDAVPGVIKHMQNAKNSVSTHAITLSLGSTLSGILGSSAIVNSFHHQAVKEVAPGFVATACTADGIIEAIENPLSEFFVGVQWHPETLLARQPQMLELFERFLTVAAR